MARRPPCHGGSHVQDRGQRAEKGSRGAFQGLQGLVVWFLLVMLLVVVFRVVSGMAVLLVVVAVDGTSVVEGGGL